MVLEPLDFSRGGFGQLVAEFDFGRQLELGELLAQMRVQLSRRRRHPVLQLDEGLRRFAAILVGNPDHGRFGDRAVRVERVFDPEQLIMSLMRSTMKM